jgi:hypothetical protein
MSPGVLTMLAEAHGDVVDLNAEPDWSRAQVFGPFLRAPLRPVWHWTAPWPTRDELLEDEAVQRRLRELYGSPA